MKQQVIFINWAVPKENYDSYNHFLETREYDPFHESFRNWNKTLGEKLGEEYEYLRSPSSEVKFADYEAWKIMFEKMFPYFKDNIILATTSLGSTFILKYMGEKEFPVRIQKLFFIAPAIADTPEEKLWSFGFDLDLSYHRVNRWTDQIYIYHSRDDDLVPFEQGLELKSYFPEAIFREFDDKWHFFLESELPEIVEDITEEKSL